MKRTEDFGLVSGEYERRILARLDREVKPDKRKYTVDLKKYNGIKAKKYELDGYKFDSETEMNFYIRYIKNSGYKFDVHKRFKLVDKFTLGGMNQRGKTYAPDFVVYDEQGKIKHVYDVKASFSRKSSISPIFALRATLFQLKYNLPVEVVRLRKHDFRMVILNFTTNFEEKTYTSIKYDTWKLIGG